VSSVFLTFLKVSSPVRTSHEIKTNLKQSAEFTGFMAFKYSGAGVFGFIFYFFKL